MALNDLLANPENAFQTSFLRAEQNRRAQGESVLRQHLQEQNLMANEAKLQMQQQEAEKAQRVTDLFNNYKGDKKALAEDLITMGAPQYADSILGIENAIQQMDQKKQKEIRDQIRTSRNDVISASDAILQAFRADPSGRQGMLTAIQAREQIISNQANPEASKQLEKNIPDFRGMHPTDVMSWVTNERNKSLAMRQFDDLQQYRRAMEKASTLRAETSSTKGYKKTKSDRQMELAKKISQDKATPEEIKEFDLLSKTDPLDIAIRESLKKANQPVETKSNIDISHIPKAAIDRLKQNPQMIKDFEEAYGVGTSKAVLGG